ncbi:MAG: acetyl-CoA carboxylase carboxyl transferase subunit alpha/beta [Deltaproteobacteria bacterium]|nr:MAG: acetyl-CoA carboxylase carboxyl transferase subunit alpha/beta [Deltaproteobacteria bacterium]
MKKEKIVQDLKNRLAYIQDIFGPEKNTNIKLLEDKLRDFISSMASLSVNAEQRRLAELTELFEFLERQLEQQLTPMHKVRIVRNPTRICLKDILENVYDDYTELGGQDEYSIDPGMVIARATINRRSGKKVHSQMVMVIGQEKGHGQDFRNGGSVKPWGNAKALQYMKVAEVENLPIHTYIFTPGSYPIEDYPGAAQQIAKNLYEMSAIRVPVVSVISEGGSGGAEAIGLADRRIMFSHGYYSVISPEGAAAIEGRLRAGKRASSQLISDCAANLKITAADNLEMGYIDQILQEPILGARSEHYDFFKKLRLEILRATDEIVLGVRRLQLLRSRAVKKRTDAEIYVRWGLGSSARDKLIRKRYKKYRNLAQTAYRDRRSFVFRLSDSMFSLWSTVYNYFRYDFLHRQQRKLKQITEEVQAEGQVVVNQAANYWTKIKKLFPSKSAAQKKEKELTRLSSWDEKKARKNQWLYISPQAKEDRAVSCPNAHVHGCLDQWGPDLFGEWAGVCSFCGHHFPMEYEWYLHNVFDQGSMHTTNNSIESINPLNYPGFADKLAAAKEKTGQKSSCMTFDASIKNIKLSVAMFMAAFRGGSVGAAEGEKFIRAIERARSKHYPFLAYVHGTAGIRIQEGTNGVIQMPRCTMAVRRYIEAGGLYLVLYDTNSYAGPVASFLGCSPYQFAVRSANIGFAGLGVIKETTGLDIAPDYHNVYKALSRGHIHGIWDRREIRNNLYQALQTMGGRNLYYR